ncbi:uncharacterized protein LOC116618905 isoform X2 [Nematostella vectensis]|nr:uncharacterized protein LOC116618905 isoform X2 [Nematostella vectensis]
MWAVFLCVAFVILSRAQAITDPLPTATIEPFSISIRCPQKTEFQYKRSDASGADLVVYYACAPPGQADGPEMSQTIHCTNNMKATYRRDLIPDSMKKAAAAMATKRGLISTPGQEPDFGLFGTGPDFEIKNGCVMVYACLNPN